MENYKIPILISFIAIFITLFVLGIFTLKNEFLQNHIQKNSTLQVTIDVWSKVGKFITPIVPVVKIVKLIEK